MRRKLRELLRQKTKKTVKYGCKRIAMTDLLQHNCARVTGPPAAIYPIFEVIVMSGDPFQVHFHPKLGVVIYDPVAQMGLAREQMRLFKVGSMTSSTFMRGIVSKDLSACEGENASQSASAVESYRVARTGRRKPYCESCRRHYGSVDFTVCGDCNAIRCTCGTCSCVSSSRRRKAA